MPDLAVDGLDLLPSDKLNLAGTETGRMTLSHTTLGLFLSCPQKYEYAKVRRLEPVSRRAPLAMGHAAHYGVEKGDPLAGAAELVARAPLAATQEEKEREEVAAATVEAMVGLYLREWPEPPGEVREYEYLVRLRNPWSGRPSMRFDLHGFADGVIDRGDHLELVERKFVGQITEQTIRRLKLDRQISLACYGLWRATGKPVRVVHYRYVRRPTIRRRQNETHLDFLTRLRADYEERPDHYSHAESLFRDTEDLLRIEAELWLWANQLGEQRKAALYPRNTSHCADYGGCEYLPLCLGDPDAPSLYREREAPILTPNESEAT